MDSPEIYALSRSELIGGGMHVGAGFLSASATLISFAIMLRRHHQRLRDCTSDRRLFQEAADVYMLSLFIANLVQAVASITDLHWVYSGIIEMDRFCAINGLFVNFSLASVILNNLAITMHATFAVWWPAAVRSIRMSKVVVIIIWLYSAVITVINYKAYTRDPDDHMPFACWNAASSPLLELFGIEYWYWVTLAGCIMSYLPLYLRSRGIIDADQNCWWKINIIRKDLQKRDDGRIRSLNLLLYPVGFVVLALPVMLKSFVNVSAAVLWSLCSVYTLSGLYNTLVFIYRRDDAFRSPGRRAGNHLGVDSTLKGAPPLDPEIAKGDK